MAKKRDVYVPAGSALDGIDITACFKRACTLQVLVCGKTRVGKSSLINSLVGAQVRKVGDPGAADGEERFDVSTSAVAATLVNVDGVFIAVYDSPGLQQGSTVNEEMYLQNMYDNCKDVDLVLYCVDMTVSRYSATEIRTTELLAKKFGQEFWKHCVLVMTKANRVRVPRSERGKERAYHQRLYTNLLQRFREQLIKQGVPKATAHAIPAVAAGYYEPDLDDADPDNERYVWYASDRATPSDQPVDFLTELWVTCFETMRGSAQDNVLRATLRQRVKPSQLRTENEQQLRQLLEERERRERDVRKGFEQKFRERESRHEEELKRIKEKYYGGTPLAPPSYDASCHLRFEDGHQYQTFAVSERATAVRTVATKTIIGAVIGAAAGGTAGIAAGPLGVVVGIALGGFLGGVIGVFGSVIR